MMQKPLNKTIGEMYAHYAPYIDEMFDLKFREVANWPVVGNSSDETLINAYRKEFTIQALRDLHSEFRKYV